MIIAIDPGTTESAAVVWDGAKILAGSKIYGNEEWLSTFRTFWCPPHIKCRVAVEMVACYGMPVGREVFETCLFIGRLQEIAQGRHTPLELIYRRDIKLHHCQSARAKDSNVRQSLIDKYGPPGTKKQPGRTYGLKSHLWSAFAIATYITETTP